MDSELLRLAERVEAAMGPDRYLNLAIANAIYGDDLAPPGTSHNYTGSLDTAMTLVPEGYVMASLKQRTRYEIAEAVETSVDPNDQQEWHALIHIQTNGRTYRIGRRHFHHGFAPTPALALTAAALRARAHEAKEER